MSERVLSFCEPVTATPFSKWHIREVGPEGLKLDGGIPNEPLCGRDLRHGWDLQLRVDAESLTRLRGDLLCPNCDAALAAGEVNPEAMDPDSTCYDPRCRITEHRQEMK